MVKRPVYQFKISLDYIKPTIWRRIQLSDLGLKCRSWTDRPLKVHKLIN